MGILTPDTSKETYDMDTGPYYPIRQKMLWVMVIQFAATGLTLAGIGAEVLQGWVAWLVGGLDILVLAGALYKGTTAAEFQTTPLDPKTGVPLNPDYQKLPPPPPPPVL